MQRALALLAGAALALAACSTAPEEPARAPTTTSDATTLPATVPTEQPVSFATPDGLTLEGTVFGDGPAAVVLAHMRPATMDSWFDFARVLAEAGYRVLAFNFRGYGNSESDGFAVDVDTAAAIDFIGRDGGPVFVIGASMGGTGAVAAAADRAVAGVATLSAPVSFEGTDAIAAAAAVTAPLLLVAAEADAPYAEHAASIADASTADAEVVILDGSRHGTDLFRDHDTELTGLLLDFLAANG